MTDSNKDTVLASLRQQRSKTKGNITRIKKLLEEQTEPSNSIELECRLEILNSYVKQLMALQTEIEKLDANDAKRGEFEDVCIEAKALLVSKLRMNAASNIHHEQSPNDSTMLSQYQTVHRLPALKIPKFGGNYSEYKNFISCFNQFIHNEPMLTKTEKFNHLIAALTDDALRTVKAFQVNDENYDHALARLKERYDNKCLIFKNLITSLFEIRKINKPNPSALIEIVDTVSAILDSLASLGTEKEITHSIIIHLVLSKVDPISKSKWDEQLEYKELPTWSECSKLLVKRCQFLELNEDQVSSSVETKSPFKGSKFRKQASSLVVSSKAGNSKCVLCHSKEHYIYSCESFREQTVDKRFEFIKSKKLCINCLRDGHSVSRCKSSRCKVCHKPHHTLLHRYTIESPSLQSPQSLAVDLHPSTSNQYISQSQTRIANNPQAMHTYGREGQTILATALVMIRDKCGMYKMARALLDSGSQVNFIAESFLRSLSLKKEDKNISILGIGEASAKITQKVNATLKSMATEFTTAAEFYVLPSISSFHPNQEVSLSEIHIPQNIKLADPNFDKPQRVDLLLGADIFFEVLSVGQIRQGPNLPTLQKTLLGWIVSGRCSSSNTNHSFLSTLFGQVRDQETCSLNEILTKFWEIEELPTKKLLSEEQKLCEEHFVKNTLRLPNGRFEVRLPFKSDTSQLGLSFETARRRFLSLERRLAKNIELKKSYSEFMNEYIDLGHMTKVVDAIPCTPHYFIPHQYVLRPDSITTKLRVVFDASTKTTSQLSLNDVLMVGPTIQADLFSTLVKFRLRKYAMSADITKMYRQISVNEEDRRFQLIIWRENEEEKLGIYQLNTITYGTASAPYMAIRCLKEASHIFVKEYPLGARVIDNDFYVDDLLTGADNEEELKKLHMEITAIMNSCGFPLAKWNSNSKNLFHSDEGKLFNVSDQETTKTLGLIWEPKDDCFKFSFKDPISQLTATKRHILSLSSKLFDPLGILGPFIIKAKILLQELWLSKLDWDESVPMHIATAWSDFKENLARVNSVTIPRFVGTRNNVQIQIHGFADASIRAYGCCIYIRCALDGNVSVQLLAAKSKVAPLKTKTLPRLELCAAHLLTRLWTSVKSLIDFEIQSRIFWTDSQIVLHWLKKHPSSLSTFVSNRIADIQENHNQILWQHVPSSQNPADIISRGCSIDDLQSSIWFSGPEFLHYDPTQWPSKKDVQLSSEEEKLEIRKANISLQVSIPCKENAILKLLEKYSSYTKVHRIVAYILRFISSARSKEKHKSLILSAKELELAFMKIVTVIQQSEFSDEMKSIRKGQQLEIKLQKLSPFLNEYEDVGFTFSLLRVGGRLLNSSLPYESKFPLLLRKNSHFVSIYLRHLHLSNCHAGAKILVALLRQKIWIVNAKEVARKTVRQCIRCFKFKPKLLTQMMGNLPHDRFVGIRPFIVCGVDFCGPIYTTFRIRGKQPYKTYVAVFVCFSSKAIHLEVVPDLMTDSFLMCLRRFIGRRGLPKTLWCDNATNFKGAANLLNARFLDDQQVTKAQQFAAAEGIEIRFIPPRAPHFGGLWEAAVKSTKHLLLRTLGGAHLTLEELQTILIDVEAVLNSRPISAQSEDPSDGEIITPGHLLIGTTLKSIPSIPAEESNNNLLKRYRHICSLKERFWRVWLDEYVRSQQEKTRWLQSTNNLQIGTLVMVHEDNLPPQKWVVGKVVDVNPGTDGKVRVAQVQLPQGVIKRPIHKLAPLPLSSDSCFHSQTSSRIQPCNAAGVASND